MEKDLGFPLLSSNHDNQYPQTINSIIMVLKPLSRARKKNEGKVAFATTTLSIKPQELNEITLEQNVDYQLTKPWS